MPTLKTDRIAPIRKLFNEGRVHFVAPTVAPRLRPARVSDLGDSLEMLFGIPVIRRDFIPEGEALVVSGDLQAATPVNVCRIVGIDFATTI